MSLKTEDTVQGTFHQGDTSHFNQNTAGRQCMANAVAGAVYATMLPINFWTSSALDHILVEGDNLYSRRCNSRYDYLQFSDIHQTEHLFREQYVINAGEPMTGLVATTRPQTPPFFSLRQAIGTMEVPQRWTYGVLTMAEETAGVSVLLCIRQGNYYIFDSHSRNRCGNSVPNGTSVLLHFTTQSGFIKYIRNIARELFATQFEITVLSPVSLAHHNMMRTEENSQNSQRRQNVTSTSQNETDSQNSQDICQRRQKLSRKCKQNEQTEKIKRETRRKKTSENVTLSQQNGTKIIIEEKANERSTSQIASEDKLRNFYEKTKKDKEEKRNLKHKYYENNKRKVTENSQQKCETHTKKQKSVQLNKETVSSNIQKTYKTCSQKSHTISTEQISDLKSLQSKKRKQNDYNNDSSKNDNNLSKKRRKITSFLQEEQIQDNENYDIDECNNISQQTNENVQNETINMDECFKLFNINISIVQPITREVKKSNISTTASTTVAEIHVCDKHYHLSQQLLPLLNPVTIKSETTSTTNTEREQQTKHEKDEQEKMSLSRITNETTSTTSTSPAIQLTDNTPHSTDIETRKTTDDTETDEQQAHNIDQQQLREAENQDEMDEHEMHAADGLLMLQELAQFDVPDTEEDENSQLMPIGNAPTTSDPATQIGDLNETTTKDTTENDTNEETSEDTVIYDPPVADLTTSTRDEDAHPVPLPEKDEHADVTLQTESENIAKRKPEKDEQTETQVDEHTEATLQTESENTAKEKPEKDEQTETQEKDKKGTLVIREIGLRKGGTRTDADTIDDTPMPTITSSGKVRCNFCRRDFDTLAEQKQHMTRRHPDQLREQETKRKREKDERIEREQFKIAIETLKKQEQEKKKKPNKPANTTSEATKARKPKVLSRNRKSKRKSKREDGEPPRKKQKIRTQDTTTSTQRRYRCPSDNCNKSYDTQAELNKHHKKSHPPVECPVCKKELPTPNTLDRHMYKHRSTLECQYCDETFAFQSELELHLIKHEDEPTFFCKSCTRSFMRVGDLREHEESHTGKKHHCTIKGCNFSAPLKRYVKTHIKTTHANKNALPYPCPKCTQKFKFYEQRKRHLANEHH